MESNELALALSDYYKLRSLSRLAQQIYQREEKLYNQNISSQQEMLEAQAEQEQRNAELTAAKQRLFILGLTKTDLLALQNQSGTAEPDILNVRAPFNGTIIEKHAVTGEVVEQNFELALLANLDSVWVWGDIYERDLARLLETMHQGPVPVEIRQSAFSTQMFTGTLDYVAPVMDEQTRTIKIRAVVENTGHLLRPGMFCDMRIVLASADQVVAVPEGAVLSDEGESFVYTHMKDDYFVRRPVTIGRDFGDTVEIVEGLEPDEVIVTHAAFLLKSDTLRSKMGAGCAD